MANINQESLQQTLEKVQARKAAYAQKTIEGVSPEAIQAVKKMNAANVGQGGGKDFMIMSREYQAQHKCRLIDAMAAITRQHPEAHEAYIRRANA